MAGGQKVSLGALSTYVATLQGCYNHHQDTFVWREITTDITPASCTHAPWIASRNLLREEHFVNQMIFSRSALIFATVFHTA